MENKEIGGEADGLEKERGREGGRERVRDIERKAVMAEDSCNGYLNHEAAKKAAHASGFGEERLAELRGLLGKVDGDALRIVGVGAGAWGSVFIAMLQDAYGALRDSVQVRERSRFSRCSSSIVPYCRKDALIVDPTKMCKLLSESIIAPEMQKCGN